MKSESVGFCAAIQFLSKGLKSSSEAIAHCYIGPCSQTCSSKHCHVGSSFRYNSSYQPRDMFISGYFTRHGLAAPPPHLSPPQLKPPVRKPLSWLYCQIGRNSHESDSDKKFTCCVIVLHLYATIKPLSQHVPLLVHSIVSRTHAFQN